MKKEIKPVILEIPQGVSAEVKEGVVYVRGPKGGCKKDFNRIRVDIKVEDNKVIIRPIGRKRSDYAILNAAKKHILNLFKGVQRGFVYKLKIVYSHFPINVRVKGKMVYIENFYGEKEPRKAKIVGDLTKVRVEGDDVIVEGPCLEEVSQTAANIEQSTRIKNKDQRVFLDGVYIYEKGK